MIRPDWNGDAKDIVDICCSEIASIKRIGMIVQEEDFTLAKHAAALPFR